MGRCAVCGKRRAVHRHHLVKQQRIRNRWRTLKRRGAGGAPYTLTRALSDPRLWIAVCGFDGCHVEESPMPIPDGFWAAVDEYGLEPDLPRWLTGEVHRWCGEPMLDGSLCYLPPGHPGGHESSRHLLQRVSAT